MKKLLIIITTLFLGCGFLSSKTFEDHKSVNYKGVKFIYISSEIGDIDIIPEDRDDVDILLQKNSNKVKLSVSEGDELKIEVKNKLFSLFSFGIKKVRLIVRIPNNYEHKMQLHSSSGDISIEGFSLSDIKIKLSSGDLTADSIIVPNANIINSSGDIGLHNSDIDKLNIEVSSGDIELNNFSGQIVGESSSGKVEILLSKLIGDIKFDLSSGDFDLTVPKGEINSNFKLSTSSGDIDFNFPITISGKNRSNSIEGVSGNGKYNIDIHASSGDIKIEQ